MIQILPFVQSYKVTPTVTSPKEKLYEHISSNPAFTERNIQKPNAYLLDSRPEQKSLVTYHTLQSLYVCVWLVNTLTSTAPIGSPIICMWSPADICEQWERNLSFGADVRGAGTRNEPLRTSVFEQPNLAAFRFLWLSDSNLPGWPVQLIREVSLRFHFRSSSSSTHIYLALRRLLKFCLTLTR